MIKRIVFIVVLSSNFCWAEIKPNLPVTKTFLPKENWFVPSGTIFEGSTLQAIFSFNLAVPVTINVENDVVCPKNGQVVIPAGTALLGSASVIKSDNRVNIQIYRLVLPAKSGAEYSINALVLSPDGSAGIKGNVQEYKETKFLSSAALGAISGVSEVAGLASGEPVLGGAVGGALASSSQQVNEFQGKKADVSITVPPFQKVRVILMDRFVLDGEDKPVAVPIDSKWKDELEKLDYKGGKTIR